ncbi:MAG: carboxypeptidase regulatory-like domain-containing protein [Pirellulaceae bacterium]|nr:carboxypeptidase regulatory-like domain-containing protein [Pirellulaceae bacterium]
MFVMGCSGGGIPGLYPVRGVVKYQGKPVDGATVSFVSTGEGRPATAVTKPDGSYELYTLDSPGALPGSYSVIINKLDAGPEVAPADLGFDPVTGEDLSMKQSADNANKKAPKPKQLVPAKYAAQSTTPLKVEVKDSSNTIDLTLE